MSGYWNQQVIIISGIIFQEDMLRTDVWLFGISKSRGVWSASNGDVEKFFSLCAMRRGWHATRGAVARRSHFQCVS